MFVTSLFKSPDVTVGLLLYPNPRPLPLPFLARLTRMKFRVEKDGYRFVGRVDGVHEVYALVSDDIDVGLTHELVADLQTKVVERLY